MYAREELEGRVFAPNKEERIEAALKDYRSKEEAKVQVIERGIILAAKKNKRQRFMRRRRVRREL